MQFHFGDHFNAIHSLLDQAQATFLYMSMLKGCCDTHPCIRASQPVVGPVIGRDPCSGRMRPG